MRFDRLKAQRRLALPMIIFVFLILGVIYSVVTPVFEAPDEGSHFLYVAYVTQHGSPPVQNVTGKKIFQWEAAQPPLYYLILSAPMAVLLPHDDIDLGGLRNPHAEVGLPLSSGNKNLFIHSSSERFPWHGVYLAVHVLRFLSLLFGAVTVWLTWKIALCLTDSPPVAVLASSLVAFNPMFLFISASVNNDNAVALFGAAAALLLVCGIKEGFSFRRTVLLGLLVGMGVLSKLSALTLFPVSLLGVLVAGFLHRVRWREILGKLLLVSAAVVLVSGWWFVRNLVLYKSLTGLTIMSEITNAKPASLGFWDMFSSGVFRGFRYSYWGLFGGFNVLMGKWMYDLYDLISGAALLGAFAVILRSWRNKDYSSLAVLSLFYLWLIVLLAALAHTAWMIKGAQGRHLFAGIGAISTIGASGILLLERNARMKVSALVALVLLFLAVIAPFKYIQPAYARKALLDPSQLPVSLHRLDWTYDGTLRLIGVEITPRDVHPGSTVKVKACWTLVRPAEKNYSIFVHVWGPGGVGKGKRITNLNTYPGLGSWPTSQMPVEKVLCDVYRISVPDFSDLPLKLTVEMGAYLYKRGKVIQVNSVDSHGNSVDLGVVGYIGVTPTVWPGVPADATPVKCMFGDSIELAAYRWTGRNLVLYWKTRKEVRENFKVFVHVLDSSGHLVYQVDTVPTNGRFPTSLWPAFAVVPDGRPLGDRAFSQGKTVEAGLYSPDTGRRLPVSCEGAFVSPDMSVSIPIP